MLDSFYMCEYHKGFYCDSDPLSSLRKIEYSDFFEVPDDDEFPYGPAELLLRGSCHWFALALQEIHNYNPYIIKENKDEVPFHAFCQIYDKEKRTCYYVDARGITSSFREFIKGLNVFVNDEYIIRPVSPSDIDEWKTDEYHNEAYKFAEAIIRKYEGYYTL